MYTQYKKKRTVFKISCFRTVMLLVIKFYVVVNQKHMCDQIT